ncbi:MAG: HNH endonuclease [Chloroflexi bacterium]|nr:HNH endonuclease [Chloroflexota bacterium]MYK33907.1 HNH endonuclease [Chloroflexota bacterium]
MAYWMFKQSDTPIYPEGPGHTYVYDNMHSVRVEQGDLFIYLSKKSGGYAFTGHGIVEDLQWRQPTEQESEVRAISRIYTAIIGDYIEYSSPFDIRTTSKQGKRNRLALGIVDVNQLGWSRSVASLNEELYERILTLAYRQNSIPITPPQPAEYEILDAWSFVKRRHGLERFKETVLSRQGYQCAICGTRMREVLDVAHLSGYANDVENRANPANGIGLCAYCHRAFDSDIFRLSPNGVVQLMKKIGPDQIAELHLSNLSNEARRELLNGIDEVLLLKRYNT